jgi:FecR protein
MPSRMNPHITGSLAVLLASTALSTVPAIAQDVGTAAAVNPLSQSMPPGGETRVLRIGAWVVRNERIQTTASGTVQLLFVDKTTLNIGPNSNLVIDSFVYDPATGTGQMVTSLAKGALRLVGGQLSHLGAVKVKTPVATIGIRGGIATIAHGPNGTRIINDFGWLSITNGCGTTVISSTGFAVTVADWMSCPTEQESVTQSETNKYLELLTSKAGQTGGAPSLPTDALVGQFGIGQPYGPFGPDSQPVRQQTNSAVAEPSIDPLQLAAPALMVGGGIAATLATSNHQNSTFFPRPVSP